MTTPPFPFLRSRSAPLAIVLLLAFAVGGCGAMDAVDGRASHEPAGTASNADASPVPASLAPAASIATAASPSPAPGAPSAAIPSRVPSPAPPRTRFALNLYRTGDYVAQYTFDWCVGASLQMALNMTTATNDTTRSHQEQLWEMAQARSSSPFGGANPVGWTAALNDLGIGPYVLVSIQDFDAALQVAARALRETKRPVGLVMWRGRHAWVMSGFESNGDPALHEEVAVTGIRVLDPLYPHGSRTWGPSPKPNALITPATLQKQFVVRDHGRANLGVPPGYLLVLPTLTAGPPPI